MGSVLAKGKRRCDRCTQSEKHEIRSRVCSDSTTSQGIFQQPPKLRARIIAELQEELTLLTLGLWDEIIIQ